MRQSDARAGLRELVRQGTEERMFPGAVAYVSRGGRVLFHEAFGRTTCGPSASRPIRPDDRFDLASVTKLYTTTVVLRLVEQGLVGLQDPVSHYVPEVRADWTVEDLLAHRTGTTANLLGLARRRGVRPCQPGQEAALWAVIRGAQAEVELAEGQSHYSDIDLLLAQAVCERATGQGLSALLASELVDPFGWHDTGFCPADPERCVPTEIDDQWRHGLVVGQVHDEMAATLGGVAGHAGLFSTAAEVGQFCEAWLGLGPRRFLRADTRELAFAPHSANFGLGWRLCNATLLPALAAFGARCHLGFTGTSAIVFPESQTVFVLLTNRVYPTRDAAPSRLPLLSKMALLAERHARPSFRSA